MSCWWFVISTALPFPWVISVSCPHVGQLVVELTATYYHKGDTNLGHYIIILKVTWENDLSIVSSLWCHNEEWLETSLGPSSKDV